MSTPIVTRSVGIGQSNQPNGLGEYGVRYGDVELEIKDPFMYSYTVKIVVTGFCNKASMSYSGISSNVFVLGFCKSGHIF